MYFTIDLLNELSIVSIAPLLGITAGTAIPALANTREIGRTQPIPNSTGKSIDQLDEAFDVYLDKIRPGAKAGYSVEEHIPPEGLAGKWDVFNNPDKYASSGDQTGGGYAIDINPNADRAYYAHEQGHIAGAQTDVGNLIRNARVNPKLAKALMGALLVAPGAAATLTPGDEDLATSVGLAYAASAPTILDEINATRHGLGILDTAGMRASLGQRGKLATGLLTYLGAPLLAGTTANYAGNLIDEDIPTP